MPNEQMREMWSRYGGPAWIAHHELVESVYAPFNEALAAALAPVDGLAVLDVGCGPGSLSKLLLDRGAMPVGVDISDTMIDGARQLVPGARFEVADAQVEPLRGLAPASDGDGGFDRVTSRFGVMFFDDPVVAFENLRAATKPAARMAFACWRSLAENPTFSLGTDVLVKRMPEPPSAAPGAPGPTAFADPEVVRAVLDESGWADVEIAPLDAICDYGTDGSDGVERRIGMVLTGQSGRLAEQQLRPVLGEDGWAALLDEARDEIRTALVDGSVKIPGRTWLVTAANPG
jgi:SAM-dependent methyltransferase